MLVRVTNDAAGQTERLLAERLSAWTGPGAPRGVACVGAALPADGARVGALVWTPAHCVVIDVVPLSDHRDGDLAIPRHGPWSVDGRPVISTAAGRTPLDQAEARLRAVQAWLGDIGLGRREVRAVVVALPEPGTRVRLHPQWTDPELTVVLGDEPAQLREYFTVAAAAAAPRWSANHVADALTELGWRRRLPAPRELLAEGFPGPVDESRWDGAPAGDAADTAGPPSATVREDPVSAFAGKPAGWPYSPWTVYPDVDKQPARRVMARLTLALGMLIAFAWLVWFGVSLVSTLSP